VPGKRDKAFRTCRNRLIHIENSHFLAVPDDERAVPVV
jgi:hypothetical protein